MKLFPFMKPWRNRRRAERRFRRQFAAFSGLAPGSGLRFTLDWKDRWPCLDDNTARTGFDTHYVYHTAWASRVLARIRPASHADFSSFLYFAAIASATVPMTFYDFRPAALHLPGLACQQADLTRLSMADGSLPSISCLHVIEHVGLGRYGDPLDYDGDLKAMAELRRVLAPGGHLLIAVPVGRPRIQFNAHRIYGYGQVLAGFPGLALNEFALIPDDAAEKGIISPADGKLADRQQYACGCFWFTKPGTG